MNHYIIGAGGCGSWLAPALLMLNRGPVIVVDGDTLEPSNLNRQLFSAADIGKNKAVALADRYDNLTAIPEYYRHGGIHFQPDDVIFGCADNHPARRAILEACDEFQCRACVAGNGYTDIDAYWYTHHYRGTPKDPRVYYPDLLTDESGDPTRPRGCTGEVLNDTPQLVIANIGAVYAALHLYWFYTEHNRDIPIETLDHWPLRHIGSAMRLSTLKHSHHGKTN